MTESRLRRTHHRSCTLCEAGCGVAVEIDDGRVVGIRGDDADPFSRGYLCPKGVALADLHEDPDRLRQPLVRDGKTFRQAGWDEAFDLVARRLGEVRAAHGADALAVYQGNPTVHNLGLMTLGQLFFRTLGTRNCFSSSSVDQLPHMVAAHLMFGDGLMMPVPDIDRTELFLCFGANPVVSNGSLMTAPDLRGRLKAVRARGGKVIVVDPRRTETADLADAHVFLHPGTDALLLLSMLHVIFAEQLERPGRVGAFCDGVEDLRQLALAYAPTVTADTTGVAPDAAVGLARQFAAARGVAYGRIGLCTQEFGGLAAWLLYALNLVCGRLDEVGGMMFSAPAVDTSTLFKVMARGRLGFARWHSRVRGLPEFYGELPVVALAEEIETPGPGQVRALITSAGNPVLSTPNGTRLDRALAGLDFMVSIDPYVNETTRWAHVILPPTSPLERSHYDLALARYAVRNVAKYSPPAFGRNAGQRHDWEICLELWARLGPGYRRLLKPALLRSGPEALLDLAIRVGPYGWRRGRAGLSLAKLRAHPHGIDLGPLEPCLPRRLNTPDRRIQVTPRPLLADIARLRKRLAEAPPRTGLVLIGRRQLRSNNSWCHNAPRLMRGKPRCTLLIHPEDAAPRGVRDGDMVVLASHAGRIQVSAQVSEEIMRGVVSLPHGWGHQRDGVRLGVARSVAGASANDVTSEGFIDVLTGTAALSGVAVEVTVEGGG
jgi:anaerobic selenocysteine-containing dehydrogenase